MSAPAIISSGTAAGGPPVGGTGTTNTIPRWTGASTLGDSIITQDTNARAIGVATASLAPWGSAYRAIQIGQSAAIMSAAANANDAWYVSNGYWDGSVFRYTATGPALAYSQASTGHRWIYAASGTAGTAFSFTDGMILNTSGNVGIGTASPVNHGAGAVTLAVNGTSLSMMDWMVNGTRTMAGFAQAAISQFGTVTSSPLAFLTANTERARIDSAGRLLVGTTSTPSSAAVRVVVAAASGGQQWHSQGLGGCAVVASVNTAQWYVYPGANVGSEGYLSSVKLTETGLDVTTAHSTPGIKLPATPGNADTQTLDAYQEGTTTCTATAEGGGTITLTAGSDTLRYTRVGRLVTIDGSLTIDSVNTPTGRLRINTNLGAYPGAAAVGMSVRLTGFAAGLTTTPIGQCTNVGNVAAFQIDRFSGAGNITADVAAYAQAGALIRVSVTFSV